MNIDDYIQQQRDRVLQLKECAAPTTAKDARLIQSKHYVGVCKKHGEMPFLTCDNSCPVCCKLAREKRNEVDPTFNRTRQAFNEMKKRAFERGTDCSITLEDFRQLMNESDICPVFNVPLTDKGIGKGRSECSKSIDRIDANKGYKLDNVAVMSDRANRIKNDGTAIEHLLIGIWMLRQTGLEDDEIIQHFVDQL